MTRSGKAAAAAALVMLAGIVAGGTARADTVMQQCGQQYQAAKAAGTLNGATWTQFRTDCAARLKGGEAAPAPAAAAAPAAPANPLKPAPAVAAAPAAPPAAAAAPAAAEAAPASPPKAAGGRAAFVARERQCGTEWKANKASLKAATPGLTWPKYLSQCNARLKATGT